MLKALKMDHLSLDDGESFFFAKELEHVLSEISYVDRPELKARLLIPLDDEVPADADSFSYLQFERVGIAKLISDLAADLPRADVIGKKFTANVEPIGNMFAYSYDEVLASERRPLPRARAEAAEEANAQAVDRIAAFGDVKTGLSGFLNNVNVPLVAAPVAGAWSGLTSAQVIRNFNALVNSIITTTNETESPDTVVLPTDAYTYIATTEKSGGSDLTIMEFLLKTNPWVKAIVPWHKLTTAGVGNVTRAMAYRRDKSKVSLVIPKEFEARPVQEKGLEFQIPCHSKIGGVIFRKPLSAAYMDAI